MSIAILVLFIFIIAGLGFSETVLAQMGVNRLQKILHGENGGQEFTPDEQVRVLTAILLLRLFGVLLLGGLVVQISQQAELWSNLDPLQKQLTQLGLVFCTGLVLALFDTVSRRQARYRAQRVAASLLSFFRRLSLLLSPFVKLLFYVTSPFSPSTTWSTIANLEDLQDEVVHLRSQGLLKDTQTEMFKSLLDFGDTIAREVMVPRVDMVCSPLGASLGEILDKMEENGYSRLPIYRGSIDDIIGFVHVKDLIADLGHPELSLAEEKLRPVLVVPGTRKVGEILRDFQSQSRSLAIVLDEYGGTDGILTIEDIIEEIVGEITDEYDDEVGEIERLEDGGARVDAKMIVEDVNEHLGLAIPTAGSETLGGYLYELFAHAPACGETVEVDGTRFIIEAVQRKRITWVRIEKVDESSGDGQQEQVA